MGQKSGLAPEGIDPGGCRFQENIYSTAKDPNTLHIREGLRHITREDARAAPLWVAGFDYTTDYIVRVMNGLVEELFFCLFTHTSSGTFADWRDAVHSSGIPYWTKLHETVGIIDIPLEGIQGPKGPVIGVIVGGGPHQGELAGFSTFRPREVSQWRVTWEPPTHLPGPEDPEEPGGGGSEGGTGAADSPEYLYAIYTAPSNATNHQIVRFNINPLTNQGTVPVGQATVVDLGFTTDSATLGTTPRPWIYVDGAQRCHWLLWRQVDGNPDPDDDTMWDQFGFVDKDGNQVTRIWNTYKSFDAEDTITEWPANEDEYCMRAIWATPDGFQCLLGDARLQNGNWSVHESLVNLNGGRLDAVYMTGFNQIVDDSYLLSRHGGCGPLRQAVDGGGSFLKRMGNPAVWPTSGGQRALLTHQAGSANNVWLVGFEYSPEGAVFSGIGIDGDGNAVGEAQSFTTSLGNGVDDKSNYAGAQIGRPMPIDSRYIGIPRGTSGFTIADLLASSGAVTIAADATYTECVAVCALPRSRCFATLWIDVDNDAYAIRVFSETGGEMITLDATNFTPDDSGGSPVNPLNISPTNLSEDVITLSASRDETFLWIVTSTTIAVGGGVPLFNIERYDKNRADYKRNDLFIWYDLATTTLDPTKVYIVEIPFDAGGDSIATVLARSPSPIRKLVTGFSTSLAAVGNPIYVTGSGASTWSYATNIGAL